VAGQAIASLLPFVTKIIGEIQDQINKLKPPSVTILENQAAIMAARATVAANTEEHIADLNRQKEAIIDQINYVQMQIIATDAAGGSTADLNMQLRDLVNQLNGVYDALSPIIPEIYSFAEAVRAVSEKLVPDKTLELVEKVINATAGAANLEKALRVLEDIETPVNIIVDRLGQDILEFADALKLSGLPIPELIAKYLGLAQAAKGASGEMPRIANSLSKLVGDAVEKLRAMANGGDLAQGILDALARLLTGLPEKQAATQDPVKNAVDKLRGVTEEILTTLKTIGSSIAPVSLTPQVSPDRIISEIPVIAPAVMQVNIRIEDNEVITNEFYFSDIISRSEVRDRVIPEITEALTNNTDSVKEKWVHVLKNSWNGVVKA